MILLARLAIALTPHVHHGVSSPEEAARVALEVIQNASGAIGTLDQGKAEAMLSGGQDARDA